MTKEKIFKELIASMAESGNISTSEYEILLEKGKDLGLTQKSIDLLIKLELADHTSDGLPNFFADHTKADKEQVTYRFKSAITRGGSILTPDIIIIDNVSVTYRKRNKHLINVDSITVHISKISSVELDTSIWGTNIIIKTFGSGEIIGKRFSKSDAQEVKRLIQERQSI